MIQKKRWLAFWLAFFLPGVGHLYLGFNKLGLQYMIGFFACIVLIPSMPLVFPFALAIIWFYQLFDVLQKATRLKLIIADYERIALGQDSYLDSPWSYNNPGAMNLYAKEDAIHPIWLGAGCVVTGALFLFVTVFPSVWQWLTDNHIFSILLSIGLIGYGLVLIKKNYRTRKDEEML
ncbi:hypothetical protein PASE110613_07970 [Paenibacillus sediminis]|uniref:TM2 domain-containing membrane protein YozV n=1 Tax=Paenibacillus sediminis TaxID=664909 RepID=A0ABS4H2H3_9BACL|nr:hypothetical protein [Paenibacillus sediminis]MBP1936721.1 TM2 domain-containing membrane protein YozV [Paenibacillus sediminis]